MKRGIYLIVLLVILIISFLLLFSKKSIIENNNKKTEITEVIKNDNNKKYIAITFDDGPGEYTKELIDILLRYNAKSTFFFLGANLEKYSDVIKYADYNNMEIGYHSYNHKRFRNKNIELIKEEFNKSNNILQSIVGKNFKLIRPPYGVITKSISSSIDASFILWNIDTLDWKYKDSEYLKDYVLKNVSNGSIILFHDIHKTSIEAVEKLLPILYEDNYEVVTISSLASINNITLETHEVYRNLN